MIWNHLSFKSFCPQQKTNGAVFVANIILLLSSERRICEWLLKLFLSSCFFGPVKELKYQIEDTLDEGKPLVEPTKIKNISQTKAAVVTWQSDLEDHPNSDSHLFRGKENLFTISSNGNLIALNHEDGSVNWVKNFNVEVSSGISGNDSVLVFTSKDGFIYCVNLNGKLLWRTFFGRVISPLYS